VCVCVCVLLNFYAGGDFDLTAHRPMGTCVPVGTENQNSVQFSVGVCVCVFVCVCVCDCWSQEQTNDRRL